MESLFFKNSLLLNGDVAPATGAWVNIAKGRDALYSFYMSGSGAVTLQYQSPFFANDGIPFYTITGNGTGYLSSSYSASPMVEVRAVASGSGSFWSSVTSEN